MNKSETENVGTRKVRNATGKNLDRQSGGGFMRGRPERGSPGLGDVALSSRGEVCLLLRGWLLRRAARRHRLGSRRRGFASICRWRSGGSSGFRLALGRQRLGGFRVLFHAVHGSLQSGELRFELVPFCTGRRQLFFGSIASRKSQQTRTERENNKVS